MSMNLQKTSPIGNTKVGAFKISILDMKMNKQKIIAYFVPHLQIVVLQVADKQQ